MDDVSTSRLGEVHDDLDQFAARVPLDVGAEEQPVFDQTTANSLLRKLRSIERRRSEIVTVAQAERDRIDAWQTDRLDTLDAQQRHIERVLEGFMRAEHARSKTKTLDLPNGLLTLRPHRPHVEITDELALLDWARERAAHRAGLDPADVLKAFDALQAEPFVRAKIEPAKGEIGKSSDIGPQKSLSDDTELLAAVLKGDEAGEVVPGVLIERPRALAFKAKPRSVTPDEQNDVEQFDPEGDNDGS